MIAAKRAGPAWPRLLAETLPNYRIVRVAAPMLQTTYQKWPKLSLVSEVLTEGPVKEIESCLAIYSLNSRIYSGFIKHFCCHFFASVNSQVRHASRYTTNRGILKKGALPCLQLS
jgi:hypothetical protein